MPSEKRRGNPSAKWSRKVPGKFYPGQKDGKVGDFPGKADYEAHRRDNPLSEGSAEFAAGQRRLFLAGIRPKKGKKEKKMQRRGKRKQRFTITINKEPANCAVEEEKSIMHITIRHPQRPEAYADVYIDKGLLEKRKFGRMITSCNLGRNFKRTYRNLDQAIQAVLWA